MFNDDVIIIFYMANDLWRDNTRRSKWKRKWVKRPSSMQTENKPLLCLFQRSDSLYYTLSLGTEFLLKQCNLVPLILHSEWMFSQHPSVLSMRTEMLTWCSVWSKFINVFMDGSGSQWGSIHDFRFTALRICSFINFLLYSLIFGEILLWGRPWGQSWQYNRE